MESLQHCEVDGWSRELQTLRQELIDSPFLGDPLDVAEELQTSLESLDLYFRKPEDLPPPGGTRHLFRRSIDVVHKACVQTDHCCIIRRTNKAVLSMLGFPHRTQLTGMPLLIFLEKGDRKRFTEAFLRFRKGELSYANEMFFHMRPRQPAQPFLAHFSANSAVGPHGKFMSMIWLFEKTSLAPPSHSCE